MYYNLVSTLKRRLILELQDSFSRHPVYRKIVPHIHNRFAFDERPQYGIVVKGSTSNKVQLAGDNFLGFIESYVMLTYVDGPAHMLEWVREDTATIRANNGKMPTAPGVYYFECLKAPENAGDFGEFAIDPLLTVTDETVLIAVSGLEQEARLQHVPAPRSVRLWENHNQPLLVDRDYTLDPGGNIQFLTRFYPGGIITADYRYPIASIGPKKFMWNRADAETIPGVVLAFGKRAREGDKFAVVITSDRVDVAQAYGGKFEASFDLDVIAQDPTQLEEITDFAFMSLWGEKKAALEYEGIEILDVTMGGESEEPVNDTSDEYQYMANLSVQLRADWEIHVPLPLTFSRVSLASREVEQEVDPKTRASGPGGLQQTAKGNLFYATAPTIPGRNHAFERIT